ncbi:MAG: hypothetical protein AAF591_18870 [Verrucomicrobiota bacterium]
MTDSPSSPPAPDITSGANPGIGCFIMGCAAFVLIGIAIFFIYQGLRMDKAINAFTDPEPATYPIEEPTADQKEALYQRLDAFSQAALDEKQTELTLSAADLNHLIATAPILKDYRGTALVTEINDFFIIADLSQMINRILPGNPRYLNATFSLTPFLRDDKTVRLDVKNITSTKHDIPQGFVDLYGQRQVLQFDEDNPTLGPILQRLQSIEIKDHTIHITTLPPEPE